MTPKKAKPRKTVLVVDDDPEIAELITEVLSGHPYQVMTVKDGVEAVERTNQHHVDLILMDIRMPYFSGLWFCDAFKKKKNTKNIPIVIVSGMMNDENARLARLAGAVQTIKKPFTNDELLEAVEKNAL